MNRGCRNRRGQALAWLVTFLEYFTGRWLSRGSPKMSVLSYLEKRQLERLFEMSDGYVLDFSNREFEEFVFDSVGINVYDDRYAAGGKSKAN